MSTETWTGQTSNDWNTPSNWSGDAVPVAGDTVVIPNSSPPVQLSNATLKHETINAGPITSGGGTNVITFADVKLAAGTSLNVVSSQFPGASGTVDVPAGTKLKIASSGTMLQGGPGQLIVQGGGTLVNDGLVSTGFGAIELGLPDVVNAGTMAAGGFSTLVIGQPGQTLAGVFTGPSKHTSGLVTVSGGGQVLIDSRLGKGETFAFGSLAPIGTIGQFPNIISFANTNVNDPITGFAPGDRIILAGVTADGETYANGTLTVTSHGTTVGTLNLPGTFAPSELQIGSTTPNDPVSGTAVSDIPQGSGAGPVLTTPSSETVAPLNSKSVSSSYTDSFAAGNPGAMFLGISDESGTLDARNAAGATVPGSGSDSITLSTDYADVNAVLNSLTYTAGASPGHDTINFDLWNQAGVETTGSVAVTIAGCGSPTMLSDAGGMWGVALPSAH